MEQVGKTITMGTEGPGNLALSGCKFSKCYRILSLFLSLKISTALCLALASHGFSFYTPSKVIPFFFSFLERTSQDIREAHFSSSSAAMCPPDIAPCPEACG